MKREPKTGTAPLAPPATEQDDSGEFVQEPGPGEEIHFARSDAELAAVTESVVRESYPDGLNDVDLSKAVAKTVLHVASECPEIPDYAVVTLYIDEFVAGNVIWSKRAENEYGLGMIQPFGPAYIGETALEDHAQVRDLVFPPVSTQQAAQLTGGIADVGTMVYTCPGGQARHPLDFEYEFLGQSIRIGAIDGLPREN